MVHHRFVPFQGDFLQFFLTCRPIHLFINKKQPVLLFLSMDGPQIYCPVLQHHQRIVLFSLVRPWTTSSLPFSDHYLWRTFQRYNQRTQIEMFYDNNELAISHPRVQRKRHNSTGPLSCSAFFIKWWSVVTRRPLIRGTFATGNCWPMIGLNVRTREGLRGIHLWHGSIVVLSSFSCHVLGLCDVLSFCGLVLV